ncbi:MAG: hypothetical protein MK030_00880, partial [SAR116 cluster bacterium]|nr:hypothetical protein [SAR116 cluster bacterium]
MTRPDASHKPVLTALAAVLLLWPGLASAAWAVAALLERTARLERLLRQPVDQAPDVDVGAHKLH